MPGKYEIRLPANMGHAPIEIMPRGLVVTVVDDRGGKLAVLPAGEQAKFEIGAPPWWRFWAGPRWKLVQTTANKG